MQQSVEALLHIAHPTETTLTVQQHEPDSVWVVEQGTGQ